MQLPYTPSIASLAPEGDHVQMHAEGVLADDEAVAISMLPASYAPAFEIDAGMVAYVTIDHFVDLAGADVEWTQLEEGDEIRDPISAIAFSGEGSWKVRARG